jgi:hypothetical protein
MTFSYDNFMIDTKVGFMCVKIEKDYGDEINLLLCINLF